MKLAKGFAAFGTVILIIPWTAWVAATLWGWFVVPLGLRSLHVFEAAGLSLVTHIFCVPRDLAKKDEEPHVVLGASLLYPAIMLGLGALFHWLAR